MMRQEKLSDRGGTEVEVLLMGGCGQAWIHTHTDSPQAENINGRGNHELF